MPKKKPSKKLPSIAQINSGCFIDFEGFAGNEYQAYPPPVLVGVWNQNGGGKFRQYVFTEAYRWAAEDPGVDHEVVFVKARQQLLEALVDSTTVSRPLFAFSEHERTVIRNELGVSISKRYRNVRSISKAWYSRKQRGFAVPRSWALFDVAEGLGIVTRGKLGVGGVTKRLREVREFSKSRERWARAPNSVKRRWRELLEHNKSDVMLCHEIVLKLRQNA